MKNKAVLFEKNRKGARNPAKPHDFLVSQTTSARIGIINRRATHSSIAILLEMISMMFAPASSEKMIPCFLSFLPMTSPAKIIAKSPASAGTMRAENVLTPSVLNENNHSSFAIGDIYLGFQRSSSDSDCPNKT